MSTLDAMLGGIQSKGIEVELEGGLNFTGGLKATRNVEGQRIDVTWDGQAAETYATLEELRAVTPVAGRISTTAGRNTAGDNGGGTWLAVSGDPDEYAHDGIDTLVPSSGAGSDGSLAQVRVAFDSYTPEMAGALGDDTTDDYSVLTTLLARQQVTGKPIQLSPDKIYKISEPLQITGSKPVTIFGKGKTVIHCTGTNKTVIRCAVAGSLFADFTTRGNNTGTGAGGTEEIRAAAGHGISIEAAECTVLAVRFEQIGTDGTACSNIRHKAGSTNSLIANCFFAESCISSTAADVAMNGEGGIIMGCRALSRMDSFASLSGVGAGNTCHLVVGNQVLRPSDNTTCRHGVLALYGAGRSGSAIVGNIFRNTLWTGVYVNSDNGATGANGEGGVVVGSNQFEYCCGRDAGFSAALWIAGSLGGSFSTNKMHKIGYEDDGVTPREFVSHGVAIRGDKVIGVSLACNSIDHCTGYAVAIVGSGSSSLIQRVNVVGTNAWNNELGQMIVTNTSAANELGVRDILIASSVLHSSTDVPGITVEQVNSTHPVMRNVVIDGAIITCDAESPTAYGVEWNIVNVACTGRATNLYMRGFAYGLRIIGSPDRLAPDVVYVSDITTENCGYGLRLGTGNGIAFNHRDIGSTSGACYPGTYTGMNTGLNASGQILCEIMCSTPPVTGTWRAGERARTYAPVLGSPGSWIYTTAWLDANRLSSMPRNAQTGTTYTLASTDALSLLSLDNASPIALTIPLNSVTPLPEEIDFPGVQIGDGQVTFTFDPSITLIAEGDATKTRAKGSHYNLRQIDTDVWLLGGSIEA